MPLFSGVASDKRFVKRSTNQRDSFLLEVRRRSAECGMLLYHQAGLSGAHAAAIKLGNRGEVNRHREYLPPIARVDSMRVAREGRKPVEIVPHFLVWSVEQMRTVFMYFHPTL